MGWDTAKDSVLLFLCSGLACWIAFEVRILRITIEKLMVRVDDHHERIQRLEHHCQDEWEKSCSQ